MQAARFSRAFGLLALAVAALGQTPDPGEALWQRVKTGLQGPNASMFFEVIHGTVMPGGPVKSWAGTVVSARPPEAPTQLLLGFGDSRVAEIRLMLLDSSGQPAALKKPLADGARVKFAGVVSAFRAQPYQLTFEIDLGDRGTGSVEILP